MQHFLHWVSGLLMGIGIIVFVPPASTAQDWKHLSKQERKELMRDTLDGRKDYSRMLIEARGFMPLPFLITEPALGGFGIALAPMFITPKKLPGYKGYIPPDISAGFGMYTANGSWTAGGMHIGSLPAKGIKYRAGAAYADLDLSFYRTLDHTGEKEFAFNIQSTPVYLSLSKRVLKQDVYLGVQYVFASTSLEPYFTEEVDEFLLPKARNNRTAALGVFLDLDKRNTVFTPDKGTRVNVLYNINDAWTGSDFSYQQLNGMLNWFKPLQPRWVSGVRLEAQHVFGQPPFYLLPFLNMRGVPMVKYQGYTTALMETEQRWDLNTRWSMVGFAGMAKALQKDQSFSDASLVWNAGGGFRYLMARAFGLRGGIDIARGPDSWGWYIVFGHNWNR